MVKPFNAPQKIPINRPKMIATGTLIPLLIEMAVTMPEAAAIEPIDKSMPPVAIT